MLRALLRDLADVHGVELLTVLDPRFARLDLPGETAVAGPGEPTWDHWVRCIDRVDAVWPIAPETDGLLERLSRLVLERRRSLLGCRPSAVAIAASKRATAEHLAAHGIAVVPTFDIAEAPLARYPVWVLKPDDGVGCMSVRCYADHVALHKGLAQEQSAGCVLQPYVEGEPASLSMICRDGVARLLAGNRQQIRRVADTFRLDGVRVNALAALFPPLSVLAAHIAHALPDLWGYVGVDFLLTAEGPRVLEINPRLTTSYVGLRRALGVNPAALVLDLLREEVPVAAGDGCGAEMEVEVAFA